MKILLMIICIFSIHSAHAQVSGTHKALSVLVNFASAPAQQWSVSQVQANLNEAAALIKESSYGAFQFSSVDLAGYYTLSADATCDLNKIASEAKALAQAQGYNISSYQRFIFIMPSCPGTPSVAGAVDVWIVGNINVSTIAHELLHTYGLSHSGSISCDGGSIVDSVTCSQQVYGNPLDIMGNGQGHINIIQKEKLGWVPAVQEITSSGIYKLGPIETIGGLPRGLKIAKDAVPTSTAAYFQRYYYLEFRQPIGFDAKFAEASSWVESDNIYNGVIVSLNNTGSGSASHQLDMTPDSRESGYDMFDSALTVGNQYSDAASGITIKVLSIVPNQEVVVEVIFTKSRSAPVTYNDSVNTAVATSVVIDAVANDKDADLDFLKIVHVADASSGGYVQGTVSITMDNKIQFTPASYITGIVNLTYYISDGIFLRSGVVSVNVGGTTTTTTTKPKGRRR